MFGVFCKICDSKQTPNSLHAVLYRIWSFFVCNILCYIIVSWLQGAMVEVTGGPMLPDIVGGPPEVIRISDVSLMFCIMFVSLKEVYS